MNDESLRAYTITENRYGAGANPENATLQIRGSSTSFDQDDVSPDWEDYSIPISRNWRYVQIREVM